MGLVENWTDANLPIKWARRAVESKRPAAAAVDCAGDLRGLQMRGCGPVRRSASFTSPCAAGWKIFCGVDRGVRAARRRR
uniref:Uncharacterized protein n=1 Tax=Oryza punctata TaxID=4537 RepID=A0A0E0L886_ORYPU